MIRLYVDYFARDLDGILGAQAALIAVILSARLVPVGRVPDKRTDPRGDDGQARTP